MPYYRCPECGLITHSVSSYSNVGMCASCGALLPFEAPLYPAVSSTTGQGPDATQNGAFVLEEHVAQ